MAARSPISWIAVDLDGTLLDGETRVPERNVAAIRRAEACGVGLILATGKTYASAVPVMARLRMRVPGVYHQGHLIYDADGRLLRERAMDPKLAASVFAYARGRNLRLIVYDRRGLWATPGAHGPLIRDKYGEPPPRPATAVWDTNDVHKVMIVLDGDAAALRADLQTRFGRSLHVMQAVPEFVELISPAVSKGGGVAWLLDYLGVEPQALMAVGDGENDVEMLQLAGTAVAVGNASPALKAVADHVVARNDQGGVAEAVERFVLAGC